MTTRAFIYGICLIAAGATSGYAQAPAPGPNSPPTDKPAIDGARKTPDTTAPVPEVVSPPGQRGDVIAPKSTEDPAAVLRPPNVDPNMQVQRQPLGDGKAQAK
jgi:hypothetical protein